MQIIKSTAKLQDLCDRLASEKFITVDTEFMRDKTYWSKLCLIQMAGESEVAIVDPLSDKLDLEPFFELLRNKKVLKVVHAGRQDIEIFYHMGNTIPAPLFDTQVAAMACGFSDSVGYEALVSSLTEGKLDKSSRFSDWSRRPLKEKQLTYAAGDVTHLREVYLELNRRLKEAKRLDWLDEEMAELTNPETYSLDPQRAWTRLKLRGSVRRNLGVLIEVAAWRERQAQQRDLPRNRIIKDDLIYELVAQKPTSLAALEEMRFGQKGLSRMAGAKELVEAINRGADMPKSEWPEIKPPAPATTKGNGAVVELLKVLLKMTSAKYGVAQKLIANVADLEKIATDNDADVRALKGWRRDVFGKKAIDLKEGRMAIALKDGKLKTISVD